jgi:hypothetical protein
VGPRPFHLNAFKLANPRTVADHGAAKQVWALLYHADPGVLSLLKDFFGRGLDPVADRYDLRTPLDLQTKAILGLVDQVVATPGSVPEPPPKPPVCRRQGRLLAEDLRALLAYEDAVPREVLTGYIRTIIGMHLALYVLRLFRVLPRWVDRARAGGTVDACPNARVDQAVACPCQAELVIDLTDDVTSSAGRLGKRSLDEHLLGIPDYVRAVFLLIRAKEFADAQASRGRMARALDLAGLMAVLADPPDELDGYCLARIDQARANLAAGEEQERVGAEILAMPMAPLDQLVELVCLSRLRTERKRLLDLVDSLASKNRPGGLMRQRAGHRSPRWFAMHGHLLETLVQIAVVDRSPSGVRSRAILVDDFVAWLRERYGLVVYAPAHRPVPPEDQAAWRENLQALRERLRQIGFFSSLSDAFNSQTLRPRYAVGE